ncbi:MAG: aminomethyl-transferring glycine dehydrogenase subunit GcvPA [Candidatus Omnitrophica bacterium]|nr:aminomethyl-transferring glycine dehydrogenase subunit GcvPA [Candidatus Omnitrophota bacterium]
MQYISNTEQDKKEMLGAIGAGSFEALIAKVPRALRNFKLGLPAGLSELELMRELEGLSRQNKHSNDYASYLGGGNYDHFIPAVVNALAHRGEFITSYTPYQGEASQGTLQSIYEYQSLICELTAMDVSNASMYDGASSLAEAALLALRATGRRRILVPATTHPEYRQVMRTYLSCLDAEIIELPFSNGATDPGVLKKFLNADTAAVVAQSPNFFGVLEDMRSISDLCHNAGALFIASVNPISLGILEPPGEYGADIAVGEGQPLGNPLSFGGPHFGFFTVKEALLRKIPGRIAGLTVDRTGRRAFVLTLQAREQHIRREKATSNICTNHSLCALKGAIYLTLLGREGLKKLALLNFQNAHRARERLLKIKGVRVFSDGPFFNEFALHIKKNPAAFRADLLREKILGPLTLSEFYPDLPDGFLFAVTENRTRWDEDRLTRAVGETAGPAAKKEPRVRAHF